ncbi:MAG: septation protein SpoVG family protein [Planctomycetes bacterium]|nr:septation protein SpoVG family protein [Planctomycetota bacterium]
MEISEVRIKLVTNPSERLRAFCSVTFNGDFVIRDLKIIEGAGGAFVAMPSRKLADRCPRCGCKNHLRARFCNDCGAHLKENRAPKDGQGRAKLHADIAHPINAGCRERIQNAVIQAYEAELERSKQPGYKPQAFEDLDDYDLDLPEVGEVAATSAGAAAPAGRPNGRQHESRPDDEFGDYNSLIADLKRDAADRRQTSGQPAKAPSDRSLRLPPSEGETALGKPAYRQPPKPAPDSQPASKTAGRPESNRGDSEPAPTGEDDGFGAGLG